MNSVYTFSKLGRGENALLVRIPFSNTGELCDKINQTTFLLTSIKLRNINSFVI